MPNLPPAWVVETWKPVGGCKFTGYFSGVAGNSALRFCLLLKWRAIRPQATELFPAQLQGDSLSCLPAEDGDADVESVSTPSSDTSAKRADRLAKAIEKPEKVQATVFVRLSVTVHLQRPLQSGSGSPGRSAGGSRICSYQPGQPARLPTGAKCGREIRSRKPALLEFNVANERKVCPRSVRAVNRNSISHVVPANGRHLANRYHLHSRGSLDCLRPTICPLVPCFAQCAGKAKPKERPYSTSVSTSRRPTYQSRS